MLIGIVSSLLASVLLAVVVFFIAGHIRKTTRAKPFIGKYKMLDQNMKPSGGTVTIKYNDSWWEKLIGSTAALELAIPFSNDPDHCVYFSGCVRGSPLRLRW